MPDRNGDLSKSLGGVRRPRKLGVGHGVAREDGVGTSEHELSHEVLDNKNELKKNGQTRQTDLHLAKKT